MPEESKPKMPLTEDVLADPEASTDPAAAGSLEDPQVPTKPKGDNPEPDDHYTS
ncbi:hypothetical protein [Streptomyces aidingensis]|uniref:Uncharacterized protein n=1 Tax=Streptomyces aidingensis TaxID=910347 RepID=A0A1I1H9B7_9ACTN|nr:hypothetical protein [Streptomyces aidingensis]SFC20305.1 hypothetical protein SAMN05421773_102296 [Streptomyces aidingensis]